MGVPTAFGRCGPGPILECNDKRDAGLHANRQQRDTNLVQWRWTDHTSSSFYPLSYEVLDPLQQTRRGIYAP